MIRSRERTEEDGDKIEAVAGCLLRRQNTNRSRKYYELTDDYEQYTQLFEQGDSIQTWETTDQKVVSSDVWSYGHHIHSPKTKNFGKSLRRAIA